MNLVYFEYLFLGVVQHSIHLVWKILWTTMSQSNVVRFWPILYFGFWTKCSFSVNQYQLELEIWNTFFSRQTTDWTMRKLTWDFSRNAMQKRFLHTECLVLHGLFSKFCNTYKSVPISQWWVTLQQFSFTHRTNLSKGESLYSI